MEDDDLLILHSQYHGCWWPGYLKSQGINNHDIPRTFTVKTLAYILSLIASDLG